MEDLASPECSGVDSKRILPIATNESVGSFPSRLKINKKRQEGNPLIKYIRNVVFEWDSEIKSDFECSRNCGIVYLSAKYHKLHPGYIETRLKDLSRYRIKILLLLVNVDDPSFLLRDLNLLCYRVQITLILSYSVEEAAEYVETFKKTENKNFEKALEDINKVAQCRQQQSTRIDHSHQQRSIPPLSVTWTEFWLLIRPYIHWLICAALTACCVAALNIQIPIILGQLVNQIYSFIKQNNVDVNLGELKPIVFKLVSVYVAQAFTTFLCIVSLSQMGERMCADLRVRLFSHLLELPMPFFDAQNSGELSDRLNFDVQQFKSSFKECTAQGLRTTAQVFILNI
uniref:ABC transmembrane type-1 domain-containing protein n=1 Tax=Meloidogyne floridensis TaxID=298350 RepID=A0A915NMS1_9BILA